MTYSELILNVFKTVHKEVLNLHDIYDSLPLFNKGSIRSALSTMIKNKKITRLSRGVYKTGSMYVKYRHLKRIFDTHKKNPANSFDLDIELSCEGYAPSIIDINEVADKVNPLLLEKGLLMLDDEDVHLFEDIIDYHVVGTEVLNHVKTFYDSSWLVEVKLINNSGQQYLFTGFFNINENDW